MSEHQRDSGDNVTHFFPKAFLHTNDSEEVLIQLQDLVARIEDDIAYCKKQKEMYPKMQHYSDKISVLNAAKNYLCGNIGLDLLEEYMRIYPKWDKDPHIVDPQALIHEAQAFKGDF